MGGSGILGLIEHAEIPILLPATMAGSSEQW
jgi:hypothetical protein